MFLQPIESGSLPFSLCSVALRSLQLSRITASRHVACEDLHVIIMQWTTTIHIQTRSHLRPALCEGNKTPRISLCIGDNIRTVNKSAE